MSNTAFITSVLCGMDEQPDEKTHGPGMGFSHTEINEPLNFSIRPDLL